MSKGSNPRPLSVPRADFHDAWARTFGYRPMAVTHIPLYESPVASTYLLGDDPQPSGSGLLPEPDAPGES